MNEQTGKTKLTMTELFGLFHREHEDTRWVASVDSQEYLNVVLYLVERQSLRGGA